MLWSHTHSISSRSLYNVNAIEALLADVSVSSAFFRIVLVWISSGLECDPYPCRYSQWGGGGDDDGGEGGQWMKHLLSSDANNSILNLPREGGPVLTRKNGWVRRSWFVMEIHLLAESPAVKLDIRGCQSLMTLNIHITERTSLAFILFSPGQLLDSASIDVETKFDML